MSTWARGSNAIQQAEIRGNQRDLVSFTGAPALNLAYPYGNFTDETKWLLAHSGFYTGGIVGLSPPSEVRQHTNNADLYEFNRTVVGSGTPLSTFINILNAP